MLKYIKAIIFDLDGTLVDSMWMWKSIDKEFLDLYHIKLPEDLQQEIEGKSFTETATYFKERFMLMESVEEIKDLWNKMAYDKYANYVPLKEGAGKLLEYCTQNNIKLGIATSNSAHLTSAVLTKHKIISLFESIITGCDVCIGKPAPDVYLKTAQSLGVDPSECLVFEDITLGILAGKNAGMKVCAVEDEYSLYQTREKKELADYYIKTYDDIFEKTYEVL